MCGIAVMDVGCLDGGTGSLSIVAVVQFGLCQLCTWAGQFVCLLVGGWAVHVHVMSAGAAMAHGVLNWL